MSRSGLPAAQQVLMDQPWNQDCHTGDTPGTGTAIPIMFSEEDGSTEINSSRFVLCTHSTTVMPPNPRENPSVCCGPGRIIALVLSSTVSLPPEPLSTNEEHGLVPAQDRFQPSALRNSELHPHPAFDFQVSVYLLGLQGMVGVMLTSGNKMLLSLILSKA